MKQKLGKKIGGFGPTPKLHPSRGFLSPQKKKEEKLGGKIADAFWRGEEENG